jgi:hypothetical protein
MPFASPYHQVIPDHLALLHEHWDGRTEKEETCHNDLALPSAVIHAPGALAALLESGRYDPNGTASHTSTPLSCAIAARDPVFCARLLVQHGADLNQRDPSGSTPLLKAVSHAPLVAFLLEQGADILTRDKNGNTLLVKALTAFMEPSERVQTLRLLLDHPALPALCEPTKKKRHDTIRLPTAVCIAVDNGLDMEMAETLFEVMPKDLYAGSARRDSIMVEQVDMMDGPLVDLLLDLGLDINQRKRGGLSALGRALEMGCVSVAATLMDKGATLDKSGLLADGSELRGKALDFFQTRTAEALQDHLHHRLPDSARLIPGRSSPPRL